MRAALRFAVALALLAGAAQAQATTSPTPTGPAPSAAAPAAPKPKAGGDTVSGVTVMPMPQRACAPRDKDCIAIVVAELKRLYPEQLKQFCFGEQTKMARNQFVNDQLLESLGGNNPTMPTSAPVSPIVKTACASDKK